MNKLWGTATLKTLRNAIGDESHLFNAHVLFSSLIYSGDGTSRNTKIIFKNEYTPQFIEDWQVYLMLRSLCRTWIVTGKVMRDEKDLNILKNINFFGYKDLEKYFYLHKDCQLHNELTEELKKDLKYKKNVFVLSRNISSDDLAKIQFFKEEFSQKYISAKSVNMLQSRKFFVSGEEADLSKFMKTNNIHIIQDDINNLKECVEYCKQNLYQPLPILIEAGPITLTNSLSKENPHKNIIDLILLSVYTGKLDNRCIGDEFPDIEEYPDYRLVNVSQPIESESGYLKFYTYLKV